MNSARIVQNLLETFQNISTDNDFNTSVAKVEIISESSPGAEPQPEDLPYVAIYEDGVERSTVTPGWIHWIYPITVVGQVRAGDRGDARAERDYLGDDMERAIFIDPNRGADPDVPGGVNAIKTGAILTRRRISTPDRTRAIIYLTFEVEYEVERMGA